jgi:hypothetical protein
VVLAVGVVLVSPGAARQEPFVGWRFEVALDPAREYEPEAGDPSGRGPRPVAITVFYPATPNDAAPTSYDELARLGAYDRFRRPPDTASAEAAAAFQGTGPATASRTIRRERVVEKFLSLVRLSRQFLESKLRSGAGVQLDAADPALGLTAAPCRAG